MCPSDGPMLARGGGGLGGPRNVIPASMAAEVAAARQRQIAGELQSSGRGRVNPLAMVSQPDEPIIETLPEFGDLVSASNTDASGGTLRSQKPAAFLAGEEDEEEDEMAELYAKVTKNANRPQPAKKPNAYK